MEEVTPQEKSKIAQKFREFQLMGLESYGRYLAKELENAQAPIKKKYKAYIENELARNTAKVAKLKAD